MEQTQHQIEFVITFINRKRIVMVVHQNWSTTENIPFPVIITINTKYFRGSVYDLERCVNKVVYVLVWVQQSRINAIQLIFTEF